MNLAHDSDSWNSEVCVEWARIQAFQLRQRSTLYVSIVETKLPVARETSSDSSCEEGVSRCKELIDRLVVNTGLRLEYLSARASAMQTQDANHGGVSILNRAKPNFRDKEESSVRNLLGTSGYCVWLLVAAQ